MHQSLQSTDSYSELAQLEIELIDILLESTQNIFVQLTGGSAREIRQALIEKNYELIDVKAHDVRDIDEEAFRNNIVRAKLYGEMRVPQAGQFVQSVKQGGVEVEELVLQDIAADIVQGMEDDVLYLIGSGKTTLAVMDELQLENTLLGIDVVLNHQLLKNDVSEADILAYLEQYSAKAVISVIGGQGHIIGRGNQQLSAAVLKKLGKSNLKVISTKAKISALEGRPLIVDSGDNDLDAALSGTIEVTTGYQDHIIYPVGF